MVLLYHLNYSSSYYCDYFYQSANTKYGLRGGNSNGGFLCGMYMIALNNTYAGTGWYYGASISFKLFISFYCDCFYQLSGTHYAARGGGSHGSNCGIFFTTIHINDSRTSLDIGATLSFKQKIKDWILSQSFILLDLYIYFLYLCLIKYIHNF